MVLGWRYPARRQADFQVGPPCAGLLSSAPMALRGLASRPRLGWRMAGWDKINLHFAPTRARNR